MAPRPPFELNVDVGSKEFPVAPPDPDPMLTRASVTFHTNTDDKKSDSLVRVDVLADYGRTIVAQMSNFLGRFGDHSDAGPFTLLMVHPVRRQRLKTGRIDIHFAATENTSVLPPFIFKDTWRFNFLLDLLFEDGGHLIAKANGIEFFSDGAETAQSFGIE
ncbi:MAG TPA: hypothetical protein VMS64_10475 [Candidatus Methylomirabilis sp.]|nr:hypothetical protein [Candidatus Methylomirabilis sp.]